MARMILLIAWLYLSFINAVKYEDHNKFFIDALGSMNFIKKSFNMIELSSPCKSDLIAYFEGLGLARKWSLEMADAWGKLPSGVMEGNIFSLGAFDECLRVAYHWNMIKNHSWMPFSHFPKSSPAYCRVDIDIGYNPLRPAFKNASVNYDMARHGFVIPFVIGAPGLYYHQGWCLPSACDPSDIYNLNQLILSWLLNQSDALVALVDKFIYPLTANHLKHAPPKVARVVCVDENYTVTSYARPMPYKEHSSAPNNLQTLKNSNFVDLSTGLAPIKPVIWDPTAQKHNFIMTRRRELIVAALIFGTVIGILILAGIWDLVATAHARQQLDAEGSPMFRIGSLGEPSASSFMYENDRPSLYRHARIMASAISPFRNLFVVLGTDLSIYDNLPRKLFTDNVHDDSNTNMEDGGINSVPIASTPLAKNPEQSVVPGLRALSLLWAVWANTYALSTVFVANPIELESTLTGFIGLTLTGGLYIIDTFLFLSGFLAAQSLVKPESATLSLSGDLSSLLSWIYVYAYKYVRFTWLYGAVMLYHTYVSPYWPRLGPFVNDHSSDHCRSNWWTNLLYLNNFVRPQQACLPWTWYLATEGQLFLLAPILIFLFKKSPTLSTVLTVHLIIASLAAFFALSFVNRYRSVFSVNDPKMFPFFYNYYIRPYVRAVPYFLGILYGCYVYFYRNTTPYERDDEDEELDMNADNDSGINNAPGDEDTVGILPSGLRNISSTTSMAMIRRASRRFNRKTRAMLRHPVKRALTWILMFALVVSLIYGLRPEVKSLVNRISLSFFTGTEENQITYDSDTTDVSYNELNNGMDAPTNGTKFPPWRLPHPKPFTPLTAAFYNSMGHVVWSLFIWWIMWSCSTFSFVAPGGRGRPAPRNRSGAPGIIRAILSAPAWIPVSNLAFATYLIHPLLILSYYGSLRQPLYFSHPYFFMLFLAFTAISLVVALFATLIFEIPIINLARYYICK